MTFEEALEAIVTSKQASEEIREHGLDPDDFFNEVGYRDNYKGSVVLYWLGY